MEDANTVGRPWEAIDTAWVFRLYALVAGVAGVLLLGWGGMWFGHHFEGLPWGKAALVRVAGAQIVAAACCAWGFAGVENPVARKRGLLWFGIGHAVVAMVVKLQTTVIGAETVSGIAYALFWVAFALFYMWGTADSEKHPAALLSLFGSRQTSNEMLRTRYERQIGEAARQEERNRLARDLHDSVKQQIFAIQTAAATAQVRFDGDATGAKAALEHVRNAAREASSEMQAMLDQLRAEPLENAGLIAAVKQQCEALGFRTGAHVDCTVGELPAWQEFPPGSHDALLRMTQEALANVAKHARAKQVSVSLTAAAGRVKLQVWDDGAGFDPLASARKGGQGLANMRARAEEFGGLFSIDSNPGGGTAVTFSIPYVTAEPEFVYARRAGAYAIGLAVLLTMFVTWRHSGGLMLLTVMFLGGIMRNLLAWRRVRKVRRRGSR